MNIIAKLMNKLRSGTATPDEIENLDRRLFCLGAVATAGGLIARPTFVDLAVPAPDVELVDKSLMPGWSLLLTGAAMFGAAAYLASKQPTAR